MELDLDRLEELLAVVDAGSVASAARRLDLPRSTLSRRFSSLEESLGVRLVHRRPQGLRLTEAGELLVARARTLLVEAQDTWLAVRELRDSPSGLLRLSIPPDLAFNHLLVAFAAQHPEVDMRVVATGRATDLALERVDAALRFGPIADEGLIARRLWSVGNTLVAAPGYLDRRGRPEDVAELDDHALLLSARLDGRPRATWPRREGGPFAVTGRFAANDVITLLYAAVEGLGVAFLPDPVSAPYRRSGQLEPVLPDAVGEPLTCSLVYPDRRLVLSSVRAFIDFAVAYFADQPAVTRAFAFPPLAGESPGGGS